MYCVPFEGFRSDLTVKNLLAMQEAEGLIPGLGKYPGGGQGNSSTGRCRAGLCSVTTPSLKAAFTSRRPLLLKLAGRSPSGLRWPPEDATVGAVGTPQAQARDPWGGRVSSMRSSWKCQEAGV